MGDHDAGREPNESGHTHGSAGGTTDSGQVAAMLTASETAALLGVSTMTVYRLIRRGDITALRVGSVYRIPERAARAHLREVQSEREVQRRPSRR
ncbi:helix-turn-helix domain-containing protein [Nocardiopsis salina]|mgnify:CR=1 FL=1|uniref:helix-turn-helix domain-containing protein n=1 Tax=Nocardiopsis salina TaxID=245836 RepID=UPI00037D2E7C|nr:helix-turn-helix domain-containing protein [Nocardiopsis salina]